MTVDELNNNLTLIMKQFIKSRDHIDTGRMYKTITFTSTYNEISGLRIKYRSPYYIQYLEDGGFTTDFFNLPAVNDVIATFIADQLELSL